MQMSNAEYSRLVDRMAPKSKLWKDLFNAFWTGGLICTLGQLLMNGFTAAGLDKQTAGSAVSICLVFLSALLTGLGVYDRIGKYAGAGSIIPITGFANATVAPAMEFRREGLVMGIGAKIFTLSGPVLVYGIGSSILVGLIAALAGVIG